MELKNQLHTAIFIKIKRFGITKFFIYFDTDYFVFSFLPKALILLS